MDKINLIEQFATFSEQWSPRIAAQLNGQEVKLVKLQGDFIWHRHDDADEMFLVHRGTMQIEFVDQVVELSAGDCVVVPRGVDHRPRAEQEVEVILFEPAGTVNTGNVRNERTREPRPIGLSRER